MSDETGDMKLLTLIDSGALFNFVSSSEVKHGGVIKPSNTLVSLNLANGTVVCSSGTTSGL